MTNHIHVIFKSENGDLSGIVRDFKKYTAKQAFKWIEESGRESRKDWLEWVFKEKAKTNKRTKNRQFWTHYNHAVELNTNHKADIRLNYIHQNPVKAGWVDKPEEYLYSSARNYAGLDNLIDIDLM